MSWDIFISKSPISELEDCNFDPFGKKKEVIEKLIHRIPSLSFKEPDWGLYKDDECSIEFALGKDDTVLNIMLYIRGGGHHPIAIIKEICDLFEAFAMDCSTGEEMNFDDADQESFIEWQQYRDHVIKKNH